MVYVNDVTDTTDTTVCVPLYSDASPPVAPATKNLSPTLIVVFEFVIVTVAVVPDLVIEVIGNVAAHTMVPVAGDVGAFATVYVNVVAVTHVTAAVML